MNTYNPKKIGKNETQIIAQVLDLPLALLESTKYIGCLDFVKEKNLYLIHYNQDKAEDMLYGKTDISPVDIKKILACRGWIIDTKNAIILCRSYGYTVNITMENIPEGPISIPIRGIDHSSILEHVLNEDDIKYSIYYGGTLCRIWSFEGENIFSTHKKINAINSKWGNSETFVSLFEKNQNTYKISSVPVDANLVHIFLINDQSLLLDTRSKVKINQVMYLETFDLNSLNVNSRKEITENVRSQIEQDNIGVEKPINFPQIITRETANIWLSTGSSHFSSEKVDVVEKLSDLNSNNFPIIWGQGEKIIVSHQGNLYTFLSQSAQWRRSLMDGKFNIYQIYCNLLFLKNRKVELCPFSFTLSELTQLKNFILDGNLPESFGEILEQHRSDNIYGICATNLFFAVPLDRLDDVLYTLNYFERDIISVMEFLYFHQKELTERKRNNTLNEFPSLHNKKNIITFLTNSIDQIFRNSKPIFIDNIFQIASSWPIMIQTQFYDCHKIWDKTKSHDLRNEMSTKARILYFIMGLYGDILYTFLSLPQKYNKTVEAWKLSKEKVILKEQSLLNNVTEIIDDVKDI